MALLADQNSKKFSFESSGKDLNDNDLIQDTFAVLSFKGYEALSQLYNFEISLVTESLEIDQESVLNSSATFTIHRAGGDDVVINGELAHFEEISRLKDIYILYRALLVPRLRRLTLARSNQVFLDKSVQEFVEAVLADSQVGLTTNDYSFDLRQQPAPPTPPATAPTYPQVEYVSQYSESHFNFISRWLEREGIYYFFERTATGDKAAFVDDKSVHVDLAQKATLTYAPDSPSPEIIASFTCRRQKIPGKVVLKDYNYGTPAVDLKCEKDVDPVNPTSGIGDVYLYGENYTTDTEGKRLADIRAEEFLCRRELYIGESNVPFMQPGYAFTLKEHYRAGYNSRYLIVDVTHEGSQTGYLVSGITSGLPAEEQNQDSYRNSFTAIVADVQFRAERRAGKPRIVGTINAKIDAEQTGDYAELDDKGRYKVRLPFDLVSNRTAGQNSCYLRMMQPYSGTKGGGFHLPLHKGAEVLLSFINGDPDRPVIAGAVPNPDTPSVVVDTSQKKGKIITDGGNYIEFDDTVDSQFIGLYSPYLTSSFGWGCGQKSNEPDDIGEGIFAFSEGGWYNACGGDAKITILGNTSELFIGAQESITIGENFELFAGASQTLNLGHAIDFALGGTIEYSTDQFEVSLPKNDDVTARNFITDLDTLQLKLQREVDNINTSIDTSKTRIEATINQKIESAKDKVDQCKTDIEAESQNVTSKDNEITSEKIKVEAVKTDISDVKTQIRNVKTEVKKLGVKIKEAKTSVNKQDLSLKKISTHVEKADTSIVQVPLNVIC